MNEFIIRAAKARETAVYGTRNETRDFDDARPTRCRKERRSTNCRESNLKMYRLISKQLSLFEERIYNLLIKLEEDNYRE